MKMKRGDVLFVFLLLGIFSFNFVLVSAESVSIVSGTTCPSGQVEIMGLSSNTNAHGELASQNNYGYVLCGNPSASITCTGSNEILSLSSSTNAHAEAPGQTAYSTQVCYGGSEITYRVVQSGGCSSGEFGVVSLSALTNAHIGGINDYSIKICGSVSGAVSTLEWRNLNNNPISAINVSVGSTTVRMYFSNLDVSQGTPLTFRIYEDDSPFPRDTVRNISSTAGAGGTTSVDWTITQTDVDSSNSDEGSAPLEFYFEVSGDPTNDASDELIATILSSENDPYENVTVCSDYNDSTSCEDDPAGVGDESQSFGDCLDPEIVCYCSWDNSTSECKVNVPSGGDDGVNYGTCSVSEQQTDENGCDDGFLTISWDGNWIPNPGTDQNSTEAQNLITSCETGGQKVIECPAQIQLPFFSFWNILAAILIIAGVYLLLSKKGKKRTLAKKGSRKKRI